MKILAMKNFSIAVMCLFVIEGMSQSESLPNKFSAYQVSTGYKIIDDGKEFSASFGYTTNKLIDFNLAVSQTSLLSTDEIINAREIYLFPNLGLFLTQGVVNTKLSVGYGLGVSQHDNDQDLEHKEYKHYAKWDINCSFNIAPYSIVSANPTLSAGMTNRNFKFNDQYYYKDQIPVPATILVPDATVPRFFYFDLSFSLPVVINFASLQVIPTPIINWNKYGTQIGIDLGINLYDVMKCRIVRRKNKKSKTLSRFYN